MLRTTSAKVTASPSSSGWVQVYSFSPSDSEKLKTRGLLFAVIASKIYQEGVEGVSFEREVANRLRDDYYNSPQAKTFDVLRDVTQKTLDEYEAKGKEVEITCCAFADGVVYSSASRGGRVLIARDGALASILESVDGVISASGFPKSGDRIVAGTKSFFEKVSLADLKTSLNETDPEMSAENLAPAIYGNQEVGTAGGIIIKFDDSLFQESAAPTAVPPPPIAPEVIKPKINISEKFSEIARNVGKLLPKRNIYIRDRMDDEAVSHSRKLTMSVGIVLLFVLIVSIGFGIRQKKINEVKKEYQGLFAQATSEVDQAINLASVNPEESRQLFLSGESKLEQIKALKIKDSKIDDLEKKIEESRVAILGEYRVATDLFLDLGLLSSGFKGDSLSSSGGNIYILDKTGSRVVSVEMTTKKSKVVAGPTLVEGAAGLASYEDTVYLLFSDGIYRIGNTKSKVVESTWSEEAFIHAFAGNMYVLDKSGNAIYRYSGESGDTFGSQQSWLSSSTKADFTKAISWGMNGAIYVLYPNARVLKYSLGSPQGFSITGVSPEIGNIDALYANPDNQNVYLLDKAGGRVVVIDKNGKYIAQYISDQIGSAINLVVSEADKKIILLTGEKLLSIELKGN